MSTQNLVSIDVAMLGAWLALTLFGLAFMSMGYRRIGKLELPDLNRKRLCRAALAGIGVCVCSLASVVVTLVFPVVMTENYVLRVAFGRGLWLVACSFNIALWLWLEHSAREQGEDIRREERERLMREAVANESAKDMRELGFDFRDTRQDIREQEQNRRDARDEDARDE